MTGFYMKCNTRLKCLTRLEPTSLLYRCFVVPSSNCCIILKSAEIKGCDLRGLLNSSNSFYQS